MTRRSSCETLRRARSRPPSRGTQTGSVGHPDRADGLGDFRSLQPRRQDAGLVEQALPGGEPLARDDQAVGRAADKVIGGGFETTEVHVATAGWPVSALVPEARLM